MNETSVSLNPVTSDLDTVDVFRAVFDRIADAQSRAAALRSNLQSAVEMVAETFCSQEIAFMLRNRWGLSKKDAQKLYEDIHYRQEDSQGEEEKPPKRAETVDAKISMIMDYMQETSAKLDTIDREIAHLKSQVEEILKRI